MNKLFKKTIAIFICLIFLIPAVTISSATILKKEKTTTSEENLPTETTSQVKEITVYRYGPDGIITPKKVMIKLEKDQDLGKAIAEKCDELMEGDTEMQSFFQGNNSSSYILKRISSYGRGLHLRFTIRIQLDKKIDLFPLLPPYFKTAIFVPIRFCKYTRDPGAYTRISGLDSRKNITQEYHGPHQILAVGFIGFTGWIGHTSILGFFIRTGFAGVTAFVTGKES